MSWYSWKSRGEFNEWHSAVCTNLGIHYPNRNSATGEIDESATWTTEYTTLFKLSNSEYVAFVDEDIATQNNENLGLLCDGNPISSELSPQYLKDGKFYQWNEEVDDWSIVNATT